MIRHDNHAFCDEEELERFLQGPAAKSRVTAQSVRVRPCILRFVERDEPLGVKSDVVLLIVVPPRLILSGVEIYATLGSTLLD
jgi:hypothetical protein